MSMRHIRFLVKLACCLNLRIVVVVGFAAVGPLSLLLLFAV